MAAPSSSVSGCITSSVVFYILITPIFANLFFYIFYCYNIGKWYNVNEFEQDEDDPESANKPPVMKEKGG